MSNTTNRFSPEVRARAVRMALITRGASVALGGRFVDRGQDRLHGADGPSSRRGIAPTKLREIRQAGRQKPIPFDPWRRSNGTPSPTYQIPSLRPSYPTRRAAG